MITITDEMVETVENAFIYYGGFSIIITRVSIRAALTAVAPLIERAVLEKLREPTPNMVSAGACNSGDGIPDEDYFDDVRGSFKRMIDTAMRGKS